MENTGKKNKKGGNDSRKKITFVLKEYKTGEKEKAKILDLQGTKWEL